MDNKEYRKQNYLKNKEKRAKSDREYYLKNKEKRQKEALEYYHQNKEKISEYKKNSDIVKEYSRNYYLENREERLGYSKQWSINNREKELEYLKNKRKTDLNWRLHQNLRSRLANALQNRTKDTTIEELGCSIKDFKLYLEKQFSKNMSWENYGEYWEVDHIKPLSKGGSFHYTNTQPLTVTENRSKSNKF
jgi:5-methylcytosine-specific restriction endonuclease McrA